VTRDLATIYAPLAPAAHEAVQRLLAEYDVTAYDVLASEQERFPRTTEAVALVPGDSRTATLTIGWTDLPGLTVRVGNSDAHAVPCCGCDACSESVEYCLTKFESLIDDAVHHWIGIKRNP